MADKQTELIQIANELITNYNLPSRYKIKLQFIINTKKLKYKQNSYRTIVYQGRNQRKRVFGTAYPPTQEVIITSYCWDYHHSDKRKTTYQIKHTLLHEVKHLLMNSYKHKPNMTAYQAEITALLKGR